MVGMFVYVSAVMAKDIPWEEQKTWCAQRHMVRGLKNESVII